VTWRRARTGGQKGPRPHHGRDLEAVDGHDHPLAVGRDLAGVAAEIVRLPAHLTETAKGFDVFLVDWGVPGEEDADLGVADYVCDELEKVANGYEGVPGKLVDRANKLMKPVTNYVTTRRKQRR
jgi:hypothetical protein